MRRLIPAAALVALLVSACGENGQATTTAAPTTTEAATTTEDPVAYRLTLATILAGNWVGEWRNTTAGTIGPLTVDVRVDEAARTATVTIDLDGAVFGAVDPEAFALTVDLTQAPPYAATADLLGAITFSMTDTGAFSLESADVPTEGIATFWASGEAGSERVEIEYGVGFDDGSTADGVATLRRPAS
jgi:hypothetical protein